MCEAVTVGRNTNSKVLTDVSGARRAPKRCRVSETCVGTSDLRVGAVGNVWDLLRRYEVETSVIVHLENLDLLISLKKYFFSNISGISELVHK